MHWTDEAIVLSLRKHGETSAVARVFSHHHGVFAGVVKGVSSKTNRGIWQPGNVVTATWQARLPEHMGMLKAELAEPVAALLMADAMKLAALSSACALVEVAMPERHPYPKLYEEFRGLLGRLRYSSSHRGETWRGASVKKSLDSCPPPNLPPVGGGTWPIAYVRFEMALLAESGFGLDLNACAATGQTDDLIYVSPKSGRAVSREAGEPYKEKLLGLPGFLISSPWKREDKGGGQVAKNSISQNIWKADPHPDLPSSRGKEIEEILAGLRISGYFLEHWLAAPHGKKLPAARRRLVECLTK